MAATSPIARLLLTSSVTGAATTLALLLLSSKDTGHPAAALNATSHILWGDEATKYDRVDVRHTLVGALLNVGAISLWSALQLLLPQPRSLLAAARNAIAVTGLAYATDFHFVPARLTPGFERRLSKKSLLGTYVELAASLTVSALAARPRQQRANEGPRAR